MAFFKKEKSISYFSDRHFVSENTDNVKISTILNALDKSKYSQFAFWDVFARYKFVNYSDELFSFLSLNKNDYSQFNDKSNLVLVNSKYKSQCFLDNDKYYIILFGKTFEVLDFYQEIEEDEQTICYINVWSENAGDLTCYSYMAVDTDSEKTAEVVKGIIPDAQITWWTGKQYGIINFTDMYFYSVFLCGIILCVNCIGFANMWIRSYKKELAVRKMVGANAHQIHTFILKEYFKIYAVSSVMGV